MLCAVTGNLPRVPRVELDAVALEVLYVFNHFDRTSRHCEFRVLFSILQSYKVMSCGELLLRDTMYLESEEMSM
jgi:hypothetical protein